MVGIVTFLVSVLLFSGFARAVQISLGEAATSATLYFWAIAFLLGGTIGLLPQSRGVHWQHVWPSMAGGWVLAMLWHTLLLHGAASAVERSSGKRSGVVPSLAGPHTGSGQIVLQNGTFFHNLPGSK